MNHLRTYIRLIRIAENRTLPEGYTEKHHVFPKSIFGENPRKVHLTSREHWVAHLLLFHIFLRRYGGTHWKTVKIAKAIQSMSMKSVCTGGREIKNSRVYETAKEVWVDGMSGENHWTVVQNRENPLVALNKSEEHRQKTRERNSRIQREKIEKGEHQFQDPEWIQKRNENPDFVKMLSENGRKGKGKHWYRNPLTGEQTKDFEQPSGTGWEPGRLSFKHKGKS
jgi:hypothetical protein